MSTRNFTIACWAQDASRLPTWAARGCNLAIGGPNPKGLVSAAQYYQAAAAAGMRCMLGWDNYRFSAPAGQVGTGMWDDYSDASQPNAYGLDTLDETPSNNAYPNWNPANTAAFVAQFIARAKASKLHPVYVNADSGITNLGATRDSNHPYSQQDAIDVFSVADVVGFDRYIINNGDAVTDLPKIWGPIIAALAKYAPGKPWWTWIETSQQDSTKYRAPTGAEVLAQCGMAVVLGATGVGFFSHQLNGPGGADATTTDAATAIGKFATLMSSCDAAFAGRTVTSPAQLDGTVYYSTRGGFEFSVNLSANPTAHAGQTYQPYEFKVRTQATPIAPPAPTPNYSPKVIAAQLRALANQLDPVS